MITLQALIVWSIICVITFLLAPKRGRDPWKWLVFAMLFGIFALLVLVILPPYVEEEKKEKPEVVVTPPVEPAQQDPSLKDWFYIDVEKQQQGPTSFPNLKQAWSEKKITPDTYVWSDGMDQWKQIKDLELLLKELSERMKDEG